MTKPIEFNAQGIALCPNGCGEMYMVPDRLFGYPISDVPEARAFCLNCCHTMIVADERDPDDGSDRVTTVTDSKTIGSPDFIL